DRRHPEPGDAFERPARGLQHDADSAARRRKRACRAAAAAAGPAVQPAAALWVHLAVRAHPLRWLRVDRRAALPSDPVLASHEVSASTGSGRAEKARVVSGMRPTGRLHLGHLVGALGNWVPLQDQYDAFYFVADWHALTSDFAD